MPSPTYSPDEFDPNLYADGLIAYSLRLADDDPGRVSSELFHYLWRGWRNAFINGQLEKHVFFVMRGLSTDHKTRCLEYFGLFTFMLINFVPAALEVGFESSLGWLIAQTYLPSLAKKISYLLRQNSCQAPATFAHTINLLKIITNGLVKQDLRWEGNIKGAHPKNRGIMAITTEFWLSIHRALRVYASENPGHHIGDFYKVADALDTFTQQTASNFRNGDSRNFRMGLLTTTQGPYVKTFVEMLRDDIRSSWTMDLSIDEAMELARGSMDIRDLAPNQHRHHMVELQAYWGPTLSEVLGEGNVGEPPSYAEAMGLNEQRISSNECIAAAELGRIGGEVFF
jgi:hypothetical protein